MIVCLGATAAKALLGPSVRVTRDRGELLTRETSLGADVPRDVHPSAVLRADDQDAAYAGLVADLRVAPPPSPDRSRPHPRASTAQWGFVVVHN